MADQTPHQTDHQNQAVPQDDNQLMQLRREKLKQLQAEGKDPFQITRYDVTHHSTDITGHFEEMEGKTVRVAGRIMSKRVMGKASFMHIQDLCGMIQCYVQRDSLGDEAYQDFKHYDDVADIVGVEGYVFKTQKGEISVHATSVTLLSKSLRSLPEKFHGLTDTETRYRERYLDLIMNPDVKQTMILRSRIIAAVRRHLDEQGFLEVETPMLVTNAGGAAARPFITHYNALNEDRKLRISLELYLKRLIVGGLEKVYEIGRVFRNEGMDNRHNPEFTMMELYQAYTDYYGMMDLTEDLFRYVAQNVLGSSVISYNGHTIDLSQPFRRITMKEAVKEYAGVDFGQIHTLEQARAAADAHGVVYEQRHEVGDIVNLFFDQFCEDKMIQPTFVMDHPIEISPLTKKKPDDPDYVQRFELYMNGWEMANAYSELNDPIDQRERFRNEEKRLAKGDEEANLTDEDFMKAIELGMPPTGGIGFGIDRMVMLLTGSATIKDVIAFPTMRSLDDSPSASSPATGSAPAETAENGFFTPNEKIDFSGVKIEPLYADYVDFETFQKSDFRVVKVKACEAVPKSKKLLKFTLNDGTDTDRVILSGIHAWYEPEDLVGKTLVAIVNLPPRAMMGIDSCGMLISAVDQRGEEEELHLLMVDNHIPAGAKLC